MEEEAGVVVVASWEVAWGGLTLWALCCLGHTSSTFTLQVRP